MAYPIRLLIGSTLLGMALIACGGEQPTPPSSTQLPAAAPTRTAAPKPADPTQAALPKFTMPAETAPSALLRPEISNAFLKTQQVENVRYEITSQVSFMRNGQPVQQPGLSARGEERGQDRHLAISGVMNTTGTIITYEFITLDGVTFAKGLSGLPGINPVQWYRMGKELGDVTRDAPSVKTLLADLQIQDFQRTVFEPGATDKLDNLDCTVWMAQNPKLGQGFIGIANSREAAAQLKQVDHAEFKLWICTDGYIHKIAGQVTGHNPDTPQDKASVTLTFLIFDQNTPITITAPANAQEFQLSFPEAQPTPTP